MAMEKVAKAVLGVAILSGVVLAQPTASKETKSQEKFEHVKARILHMIDKRMDLLAKTQSLCRKSSKLERAKSLQTT
jgi:hypothetical protein